jgi:hypothetical protein
LSASPKQALALQPDSFASALDIAGSLAVERTFCNIETVTCGFYALEAREKRSTICA